MTLTIIIVNYNNQRVLEACLASLRHAIRDLNAEVIISDNGSNDGSPDWIRAQYPEYHVLENRENLGFAEANNRAFPLTRGDSILLLNPDTVIIDDALVEMKRVLDTAPGVGAVGCRLLNPDGSRQISARTFPTVLTYILEQSGLAERRPHSRFFGRYRMTYWNGNTDRSVDWVCGAALMIRRDVLDRVGGLDPYFFLTYDEVDWCQRIKDAGYAVHYTAKASIVHLDRQSEPQANPSPAGRLKYLTVERNSRVAYFVKHRGLMYAGLVELVHLLLAGAFLLKVAFLGTRRTPVVVMEQRLLFRMYGKTLLRIPLVCWRALSMSITGNRDRHPIRLFVNPYVAGDA